MRFSSTPDSASTVASRCAMPVPPVSSTASAVRSAHTRATSSRIAAGSSGSKASPAIEKPAASASSRISLPPWLVSGVRLSEAVTMKIRIADGAGEWALWSATPIVSLYSHQSDHQTTHPQSQRAQRRAAPTAAGQTAGHARTYEAGHGRDQHQGDVARPADHDPARGVKELPRLPHHQHA